MYHGAPQVFNSEQEPHLPLSALSCPFLFAENLCQMQLQRCSLAALRIHSIRSGLHKCAAADTAREMQRALRKKDGVGEGALLLGSPRLTHGMIVIRVGYFSFPMSLFFFYYRIT